MKITPRTWKFLSGLALAALSIVVYSSALKGGFIWDDDDGILNNPLVRTTGGLKTIWLDPLRMTRREASYWPLTYTTFWVEYRIFGEDPFGYHLNNVLLHAAVVLLVWIMLGKMLKRGAWLAAALFAVHPIHAESVAWISERKDLLSALFYILAALAYLEFDRKKAMRAYFASVVLFILAMLSKSVAVTFPAAIVLYLWWKRHRLTARCLLPTIPLFIVALGFAVLGIVLERGHRPMDYGLSPAMRWILAGKAFWFYLWKVLWPTNLMPIYGRWPLNAKSVVSHVFPLACPGSFALLYRMRDKWGKGPLMALGFFGVTLLPMLGFIKFPIFIYTCAADRYQYLASLGVITLVAFLLLKAAEKLHTPLPPETSTHKGGHIPHACRCQPAWAILLCVVLATLGTMTWIHSARYNTRETLFGYAVRKNPKSSYAHVYYGMSLVDRKAYEESEQQYLKAIELDPKAPNSWAVYGILLGVQGKLDRSIDCFKEALKYCPTDSTAYYNLGRVLFDQRRFEESTEASLKCVELDPYFVGGYVNLGAAKNELGQYEEATAAFQKALEIDSQHFEATLNLGLLHAAKGNSHEAERMFRRGLELKPDEPDCLCALGQVLKKKGNVAEGVAYLRLALEKKPNWVELGNKLAWLLATYPDPGIRNGAEAVAIGEKMRSLTAGRDPSVLDTLAAACAEAGRFDDAVRTMQQAIRMLPPDAEKNIREDFEARLTLYRAFKPYRQEDSGIGRI